MEGQAVLLGLAKQILALLAAKRGFFDAVAPEKISALVQRLFDDAARQLPQIVSRLEETGALDADQEARLAIFAQTVIEPERASL